MRKYIKTVVFIIISILICSVIISDPASAQIDTENFKEKIRSVPIFEAAENVYDYYEYSIRWDDLDWVKLVKDSKNILKINLEEEISIIIKEKIIDISHILEEENTSTDVKFLSEEDYIPFDIKLLKEEYYKSDDDVDSNTI